MTGPDPDALNPMPAFAQVKFLNPMARSRADVVVGHYCFCADPEVTADFFERDVLHHFPVVGDWLKVDPYVVIAAGLRNLTNGGTHPLGGFPTFSFDGAAVGPPDIAWWARLRARITARLEAIRGADHAALRRAAA